jgi:hypothetical protein
MLSIKDIKILFKNSESGFHSLDNNVQQFHYKIYIQRDEIINYKLHVHKLISLKFILILFLALFLKKCQL